MLKARDRRTDSRHERPFVAFCRSRHADTFKRTVALDVSAGGARIESQGELLPGQLVTLNLRGEAQRLVTFQARVMWVEPSAGHGRAQAGVRWEAGSRADVAWLHRWLHRDDLLLQAC